MTMKRIRKIHSLSLLNPLDYGDVLILDGPSGSDVWRVDRSSSGWYLHLDDGAMPVTRHKTIHSIDGMGDFIGAILEYCKGYC